METNDPTEWKFAKWYLDGWDHWETLCRCTWFKEYVDRWRYELELKIRSHSLANIIRDSNSGTSKTSVQSNKLLVDGFWKPKSTKTVGRPSNKAIEEKARELNNERQDINEDFKRLFDRPNQSIQ
jgi:hypothetical protein